MGKKFGVPSKFVLAIQEYFDLSYNCPFCLAIQIFFGVSVPHFGLPFGTWDAAILRPEPKHWFSSSSIS